MRSIDGVCEIETVAGAGADPATPPAVLIEVPHGATRREHYEALRSRLESTLPPDLEQFFFVNTDAGAPECAVAVARMIARPEAEPALASLLDAGLRARLERAPPRAVLVLRSLIPRTFIDCNRAGGADAGRLREAGYTPLVPPYVGAAADAALLRELYDAYQGVARRAFDTVCGAGGTALLLHTYAPRSIDVTVDENIVPALRRAYEPGVFEGWPRRPAVDLICEDGAGRRLAPERLLARLHERYAPLGIEVRENATYRLHPQTMGHLHSVAWPDRVVCLEIDRALLARPFAPFVELPIGQAEVARMAAPIAAAWLDELASQGPRGRALR